MWATGELRLDTASFALFFTPDGGARGLAAKPLGCLQKVVPMPSVIPGEGRSFIATTNDHVHGAVRLGFSRPADEDAFLVIAQGAEAASSGRFFDQPGRRSSMCASAANIEASDRAVEFEEFYIRFLRPRARELLFEGCGANEHVLHANDLAHVAIHILQQHPDKLLPLVFRWLRALWPTTWR